MPFTLIYQGDFTKAWVGLSSDERPKPQSEIGINGANDGDIFIQADKAKKYMFHENQWYEIPDSGGGGGGSIDIDPALSPTSANAVENRAIYADIKAEENARISADGLIYDDLDEETRERVQGDIDLQEQIDLIVTSSDVRDVVGTYADLQAYDTTTLSDNDIIKVLSDSTHDGAETYYKWIITQGVGAWSYIGSIGAVYTKAQVNQLLATKEDILTFDTQPVQNSTNPVTSGGIYNAVRDASGFQVTQEDGYYTLSDGNNVTLTNRTTYWSLSW